MDNPLLPLKTTFGNKGEGGGGENFYSLLGKFYSLLGNFCTAV